MEKPENLEKPRSFAGQLFFVTLLLGFTTGVFAFEFGRVSVPPNWIPWGEIDLEEPPSWFAPLQINLLAVNEEACFAALDRSELSYTKLEERPIAGGCGWSAGAQILRSNIPYGAVFPSNCAFLAALYWYEQELQELAQLHLQTEVERIDHFGSYSCRNVYGREDARRSQHATANALDVAAFRLANGETISVLNDWKDDTPEGRFLHDARDTACKFFNAVLSPDYNAAHANHFHLDLGGFHTCR